MPQQGKAGYQSSLKDLAHNPDLQLHTQSNNVRVCVCVTLSLSLSLCVKEGEEEVSFSVFN